MSATKAQKARLGLFLVVSTLLLIGTIAALAGASLLEDRDEYTIRFEGSVGGLEIGSQVQYNGIRVGRVEDVFIDADNPELVVVEISLREDTPVYEDTVAILNMQGITGLKYIELSGGTSDSVRLEVGDEITSGGSTIDALTDSAVEIAAKIEKLLDNLVAATSGENMERLTGILNETEATLTQVRTLLEDNNQNIDDILTNVNTSTNELALTITEVRATVVEIRSWIDPSRINRVLLKAEAVLDNLRDRTSSEELGVAVAAASELMQGSSELVSNANVTLLRTRDDLRRALDDFATSTENFAEFTQILVDNPSALISGRGETERALP